MAYRALRTVKEQDGFVKHQSSASNFQVFVNFFGKCLNSDRGTPSIYTDSSRGFDTVDHNILHSKLHLVNWY